MTETGSTYNVQKANNYGWTKKREVFFEEYKADKEAPTVVALPGDGYGSFEFAQTCARLRDKHQINCISISYQGQYPSGPIKDNPSLGGYVKDAHEAINTVLDDQAKIILLGHSRGGPVAAEYLKAYGTKTPKPHGVIFIGAPIADISKMSLADWSVLTMFKEALIDIYWHKKGGVFFSPELVSKRHFSDQIPPEDIKKNIYKFMTPIPKNIALDSTMVDLSEITIPFTALFGSKDMVVSLSEKALGMKEVVKIDNSPHTVPLAPGWESATDMIAGWIKNTILQNPEIAPEK